MNFDIVNILKESKITLGKYVATKRFLSSESVAIFLNEKPILLLGLSSDKESYDVANRLLCSVNFKRLIEIEYGEVPNLRIGVISNQSALMGREGKEFDSIAESEQGKIELGRGEKSMLVAVVLDNNAVSFASCVDNEIMKCFYPDATDLSIQVQYR